ncbi:MAG: hypothetical protein U1D26_03925 [Patescibacteria group bacterium]|nr:hypothetical protein [bacterium]MDZ4227598.1 hypothetical protein [Patescibacteria group bacterium]
MVAKDYFQDITPPDGAAGPQGGMAPAKSQGQDARPQASPDEHGMESIGAGSAPVNAELPARSIRSISAPARNRTRPGGRMPPTAPPMPPRPPRTAPRWILWGAAALSLVVVVGLAALAFRPTSVTVTPKSHAVSFDGTSEFVAYPSATAATGTLSYTVQISDIEDSTVVEAQGTTTLPPAKAEGSIVVVNNYSAAPVHLIKNTRFETTEGLVFRSPAAITIPGKKSGTPGEVRVTVAADQTGEQYNIGPVARFSLPGLLGSDMDTKVYARSTDSMLGGSSGGTAPAVAPATLEAAISSVRANLDSKAKETVAALSDDSSVALFDLAEISYQDLPNTTEAGGGVRIHQRAHIVVPVFPADVFAQSVAAVVSADAAGADVSIIPSTGFSAHPSGSGEPVLGTDTLTFALGGQAMLLWNVDADALATALAGRESAAFETIIDGFPGVAEAHARIEPFWKRSFPAQAADIRIDIQLPEGVPVK